MLVFLRQSKADDYVFIGLTNKDISNTKGSVKDFGVLGLGYSPGKACVASTFRLDKKARQEQLFKVAIHELGHTQGLPHCKQMHCFMRDAEGKNPTNEEKEFCKDCKKQLQKKGWKL
ncbi:matrixin family metalloprotease [Flectobacillus rivi]|uniref:Matrixin family metalloprotease n=1 Tax=Flectobacillus rivi TaxID=2984209 RepID=A0ABT6Z1C1_9BACT|nr:matrixin family metalloprotease [Flectobacillus rivi]MDI9874940.1 matrixin family metalloprotease [Flectobacillus rivi]